MKPRRGIGKWVVDFVWMVRGMTYDFQLGEPGDRPYVNLFDPSDSSAYVTARTMALRAVLQRALRKPAEP